MEQVAQKVSEEQLTQLQEIQSAFQAATTEIGQIEIQSKMLAKRKEESFAKIEENEAKLNALLESVREELGDGSIDINTGEFNPAPLKAE
jgi:selenocysteine lyase/cysteine desulfurase